MKAMLLAVVLLSYFVVCSAFTMSLPWYMGCITQSYGEGDEHGNDVGCLPYGSPITALKSGLVTYAGWTRFGEYMVTWLLDVAQHGAQYAYVEDLSRVSVAVGEHVSTGEVIGYSMTFIEFGLTNDRVYGITGWHWGPNSRFLIEAAKDGQVPQMRAVKLTWLQIFGRYQWQAQKIVRCESSFNPYAVGPYGELGVFQIMPSTWRGVTTIPIWRWSNPWYNAQVAWIIFRRDGYSWREWTCRRAL